METEELESLLTMATSKAVISNASIPDENILQERKKKIFYNKCQELGTILSFQ